jgi:hypothetical protein
VCLAVGALALLVSAPMTAASPLKGIWGPAIQDGRSQFAVYRSLHVALYEDDLHWNAIAVRRPRHPRDPRDPAYVWPSEVGFAVAQAKRYGMRVALQLIGSPMWANGGHTPRWAPRYDSDFASFAIAAARRYPSVHLWMIWGEPSRHRDFEPIAPARPFVKLNERQRLAPHLYARMLDAAYGALKAVSRANLVIGGMTDTAADISTGQWIENMRLPNGRPPRLDMYGHNPFTARPPDLADPQSPGQGYDFSDLGRLSELVALDLGRPGNPHPPLFLSEWTIPTSADAEFNFYVDPSVQAQWITDGLRVAAQLPGVFAVGWIHLYDEPPRVAGGLIRANGVRKPGYYAFADG